MVNIFLLSCGQTISTKPNNKNQSYEAEGLNPPNRNVSDSTNRKRNIIAEQAAKEGAKKIWLNRYDELAEEFLLLDDFVEKDEFDLYFEFANEKRRGDMEMTIEDAYSFRAWKQLRENRR